MNLEQFYDHPLRKIDLFVIARSDMSRRGDLNYCHPPTLKLRQDKRPGARNDGYDCLTQNFHERVS